MINPSYFQILVSWRKNVYVLVHHQRVFRTIDLFLCVLHARTLKILLWAWNREVTCLTFIWVLSSRSRREFYGLRNQWTEKDATMNSRIRSLSVTVCIPVYLGYVHPSANPSLLLEQLELNYLWTGSGCLFILHTQYLFGKVVGVLLDCCCNLPL